MDKFSLRFRRLHLLLHGPAGRAQGDYRDLAKIARLQVPQNNFWKTTRRQLPLYRRQARTGYHLQRQVLAPDQEKYGDRSV